MDYKKDYNTLVNTIKSNHKAIGIKITNEEIAKRLNYSRAYFSALLGGSKLVSKKHVEDLKLRFREELEGTIKPSAPADSLNKERALIKALIFEVASLKVLVEKVSFEDAITSIKKNTNLVLADLEIDL